MLAATADTELTGKGATDLVCHLDDVKQHSGRQALGQAGAVVQQVGFQSLKDEEIIWSELDLASQQVCKYENNTIFLTFFHVRILSLNICSVTKKVRKGGIGSALRTFLIFGSAFGPHWGKKSGHFCLQG